VRHRLVFKPKICEIEPGDDYGRITGSRVPPARIDSMDQFSGIGKDVQNGFEHADSGK
jgi:hypothetical protein